MCSKEDIHDDEDEEECECCRSTNVVLFTTAAIRRTNEGNDKPDRRLCKLCRSTMVSTYEEYPTQHPGDGIEIMKSICYVGNAIISKLDKILERTRPR